MIRWNYLLVRLVIVGGLVLLLTWGLGPATQYLAIQTLQSATGAKVEIGRTQVSLFPPRVLFTNVQLADPRADKEFQDVFRADSIDMTFDGDSLLCRRFVIGHSKVMGVQVGAARETSGRLPDVQVEPKPEDSEPSLLAKLFSSVTDSVESQADALIADLETKRVATELRQQWEAEYRQLAQRAKSLEKQVQTIRDQTRDVSNPLRDLPQIQQTLSDTAKVREELLAIRAKMDSLPERIKQDLARLETAKQQDMDKLKSVLPVDLSNGPDVAVELLVRSVREQIATMRSYLDSGRTVASYTVVAPESVRERGVDHDMEGENRRPEILVRQCELSGMFRADKKVYSLAGILENVSPTPDILEEPMRAKLRLEGPEIVRVEYVRDERHGRDLDTLTLHFPEMGSRPIRLGNSDQFGVDVSGGQRELWVQIVSENEGLQGRLVSRQSNVNMDLMVNPKFAQSEAAQSLRSSLAGIDSIEIDARFQGTWKDMHVDLSTNLSRTLKLATQQAITAQIQATQTKLVAKVETAHQHYTQQLNSWLGDQQNEAMTLVASTDTAIEQMRQKVMSQVGDSDIYLGKLRDKLPKLR